MSTSIKLHEWFSQIIRVMTGDDSSSYTSNKIRKFTEDMDVFTDHLLELLTEYVTTCNTNGIDEVKSVAIEISLLKMADDPGNLICKIVIVDWNTGRQRMWAGLSMTSATHIFTPGLVTVALCFNKPIRVNLDLSVDFTVTDLKQE